MASRPEIQAEAARKRKLAIELKLKGASWEEVAQQTGYASAGAACNAVNEALKQARKDLAVPLDNWRELELQRLDKMDEVLWGVVDKDHVVLHQGQVVDGVTNDGPRMAAIAQLNRNAERRAKLLGLDAPTKVEGVTTVRYEINGVNPEDL